MGEARAEVRGWLEQHWDPELPLVKWRNLLVDSGWACPSWPREWFGRGLPAATDAVVEEELARIGAVGTPTGVGMGLAAPTILAHGSDELKGRLLRPTLTGEATWCQLFSEPGSGSDLAGLTTRADRQTRERSSARAGARAAPAADKDGDEWVINGQKVWNTSAHHAEFGLLVARTDWDVPKHRGITFFALPMHQPGIEVRPLRQANGYASFNEVFFTDARVADANIVGEVNGGWTVAVTTLALERRGFSRLFRRVQLGSADAAGRAVREAQAEADEYLKTYEWYPQRAGRVDLVVERAREMGRNRDLVVRQEVAALLSMQRVMQWTAQRSQAARELGRPGPDGSLGKLAASNVARAAAAVHSLIAGPTAMLSGADAPLGGTISEVLVSVPAISIAGGTDEIQRNILGERVLGLPKEPQVDRGLPFRDVPRNTR